MEFLYWICKCDCSIHVLQIHYGLPTDQNQRCKEHQVLMKKNTHRAASKEYTGEYADNLEWVITKDPGHQHSHGWIPLSSQPLEPRALASGCPLAVFIHLKQTRRKEGEFPKHQKWKSNRKFGTQKAMSIGWHNVKEWKTITHRTETSKKGECKSTNTILSLFISITLPFY